MIQQLKKYWRRLKYAMPEPPREGKAPQTPQTIEDLQAFPELEHYVDSLEYFKGLNEAMTQNQPLNTQDLMFARLALMKLGAKFYHEYNQELGELLHIKELIKK